MALSNSLAPRLVSPRTPPGVMELLPRQQLAFQRMLRIIEETYASYGFLPIETPVFERTDVLLGKNGGETEKQVFFVEKTGTVEKRKWVIKQLEAEKAGERTGRLTTSMAINENIYNLPDEALRFDLTVPLARYVAEHEHELVFPFRRQQIQRVYRGERPQRGRLNEFYQCDIDVIGKDSLSSRFDAELPAIANRIYTKLAFGPFTINFSNRKIMTGLLEHHNIPAEAAGAALRELDKLDKLEQSIVRANITGGAIGMSDSIAGQLLDLVALRGSNDEMLRTIATLPQTETIALGYKELQIVCEGLAAQGVPDENARLNLGIIRGLDYYTGTVYEVLADEHPEWRTIGGGGRYENLAGNFTKSKLPGVGISIGASRLFDLLRDTDWPGAVGPAGSDILILMLDDDLFADYLRLATELREAGFAAEVMLAGGKLDKQMKYADRSGVRMVLLMGETERAQGVVTLKDMVTGGQTQIPCEKLIETLRANIRA